MTDGNTPLLLECGIPIKEIQKGLGFGLRETEGCLISHEHKDHSKAAASIAKRGIDCYMSNGTAVFMGGSFPGYRFKPIEAGEQFKIGTWTILPFDTQHDAAEPLGFPASKSGGRGEVIICD